MSLERRIEAFLSSDGRRESLPPMARPQRAVVHEVAKVYGLATCSYDNEPNRHVDLFRTQGGVGPCVSHNKIESHG